MTEKFDDEAWNIFLKLPHTQILPHLPRRDPARTPQILIIQRARHHIRESKEQHRRDPASGVLKRKARVFHLILLDRAAGEVMYAPRGIDFWFVRARARRVGGLGPSENVEVVVDGMLACVAFSADGGTCSGC